VIDRRLFLRVLVAAPATLASGVARASGPPAYRVIVNPSNPQSSIDRRFLADAFLKKVTRWPTGDGVRPVDLNAGSTARHRFTEDVLGRSVAAVKSYWAQVVFSGRDVPPPELDDDDAVVRYVLKHAGALGYVSAGANIDRAKPLNVK
jgi:ABC-type phosphate transport system substrate-binding protein